MDALHFENISFAYAQRRFSLSDVSYRVPHGSFTGVVGPNGAGKTTLFRLACGVLTPAVGSIRILGTDIAQMDRRRVAQTMAFVGQQVAPAIGMSVEEYVLLGRIPYARTLAFTSQDDLRIVESTLQETDCDCIRHAQLAELSGGELQRAHVARALAQQPRVLVLDEPNSHLDVAHQLWLYRSLCDWKARTGGTVIASTHDLNLASMFSDQILLLADGRLRASGPPQEVLQTSVLESVFRVNMDVRARAYGAAPSVHLLPQ